MHSAVKKPLPKVLACFFVYNEADTIFQAVEQMRKQTYSNLEIAIFDNCSTDGTTEIIEGLKDPNITCFKNRENEGAFKNLIRVFEYVFKKEECAYFLLVDVDDLYNENYIKEMVALLEQNPQAMVALPSILIKEKTSDGVIFSEQHCIYDLLLCNISRLSKAFKIISYTNLQFCMVLRSMMRRSFVKTFSFNPLFYRLEEFSPVLALYLGGIVTTPKELHIKYQRVNTFSERGSEDFKKFYDLSSSSKKWNTLRFNVAHTFSLKKLSLSEKMQITGLLFYRLFMRYKLINTFQIIKTSKNPIAQLIIIAYQPIKKLIKLTKGYK